MVEDAHRGAALVVVGIGVVLLGVMVGDGWGVAGWAAGMTFVGAGVLLMVWSVKRD